MYDKGEIEIEKLNEFEHGRLCENMCVNVYAAAFAEILLLLLYVVLCCIFGEKHGTIQTLVDHR